MLKSMGKVRSVSLLDGYLWTDGLTGVLLVQLL